MGQGLTPTPSPQAPEPPTSREGMLGKLLPELTVVVTVAVLLFVPDWVPWIDPSALQIMIMADVAMVMISATLVDVASRLRRAPPWWLGAMMLIAWQEGLWIFLPFFWSLLERIFELWTLPTASSLEKLRRRTLTFDRLYTGLVVGGIGVAALVGNDLLNDGNVAISSYHWAAPSLALLFYVVATFNAWRVHQPAFALRPRSLWPWIDRGQATDISPL